MDASKRKKKKSRPRPPPPTAEIRRARRQQKLIQRQEMQNEIIRKLLSSNRQQKTMLKNIKRLLEKNDIEGLCEILSLGIEIVTEDVEAELSSSSSSVPTIDLSMVGPTGGIMSPTKSSSESRSHTPNSLSPACRSPLRLSGKSRRASPLGMSDRDQDHLYIDFSRDPFSFVEKIGRGGGIWNYIQD